MEIDEKLKLLNAYGAGRTILSWNLDIHSDWHEDEHPTWDWDNFEYRIGPKFCKGDTVRVLDGSGIPNYTGGWNVVMGKFVGNCYTIRSTHMTGRGEPFYRLNPDCNWFNFDERGLELVKKGE